MIVEVETPPLLLDESTGAPGDSVDEITSKKAKNVFLPMNMIDEKELQQKEMEERIEKEAKEEEERKEKEVVSTNYQGNIIGRLQRFFYRANSQPHPNETEEDDGEGEGVNINSLSEWFEGFSIENESATSRIKRNQNSAILIETQQWFIYLQIPSCFLRKWKSKMENFEEKMIELSNYSIFYSNTVSNYSNFHFSCKKQKKTIYFGQLVENTEINEILEEDSFENDTQILSQMPNYVKYYSNQDLLITSAVQLLHSCRINLFAKIYHFIIRSHSSGDPTPLSSNFIFVFDGSSPSAKFVFFNFTIFKRYSTVLILIIFCFTWKIVYASA